MAWWLMNGVHWSKLACDCFDTFGPVTELSLGCAITITSQITEIHQRFPSKKAGLMGRDPVVRRCLLQLPEAAAWVFPLSMLYNISLAQGEKGLALLPPNCNNYVIESLQSDWNRP